jgi:hypothetical protein
MMTIENVLSLYYLYERYEGAHLMVGGLVRFPPGMLERGVCESQVCPAVSFPHSAYVH